MKILYIYKYGIIGGVCTQIFNRLSFLNSNLEVELLFFQDHGASKLFRKNKIYITSDTQEISTIIRENGYDLISIIDTPESFPAIENLGPKMPKIIIEVHTTTSNISYLKDLRTNEDFLKNVHFIATPSIYLKNRIEGEFEFKGVLPVHIIPNTLDMSIFNDYDESHAPGKKIIAWVGKIDDHKNWKGFLEVASLLNKKSDQYHFWLIGGYTAPRYRIEELLHRIDHHGLFDKVKWLPLIKYSSMPKIYSLIKSSGGCLLITSLNESFGMTMIEAISVGCPVIASDVGALPEILKKISPDLLYPYGDYEKAAELVDTWLAEPQKSIALFNSNMEWIKSEYDIAPVAKKYFELIKM